MAEQKQRYKELITKRVSAKGQITKFKNYLCNISKENELNDIQLTELRLKLAKFEALSVRVDDLQSEIEVLCPENIEAEINERDNMERDIIVNIATAKNLLDILSSKNETEQRRNSVHNASCCNDDHHHNVDLKLPQIQIAKFNGEYFRWLEFRDTFESLIHKNHRIPEINKFHYLNSYLQGDAARIVSNLEVSAKNYNEAWKLLCNRYNNKRILMNHHISSLVHIKQLPRESEKSLRYLVDHITKNLRALASLGQSTDNWDVLVIYMVSSKLDSQTLLKWEECRNTMANEAPTLEQFFKFITDRANVLESISRNNNHCESTVVPRMPINFQRSSINNNQTNYNQRKNQNSIVKSFATSINNNKNKAPKGFSCIICDERHRIYDCPTFKARSIDERMTDVIKYKLCINCLRQGHSANDCRLRYCQEPGCTEKHNSLLHQPSASRSTNQFATVEGSGEIVSSYCNKNTNQIILSTAMVEVLNPLDQQKIKVRALLDCGSQSSFITESLKIRLALKSYRIDTLKVIGIGNAPNNNVNESCNIRLKSINSSFNITCSCLVLKELTGRLPKVPIDISLLQLPDKIQLADPMFYKPDNIDILIGADIFWDILGNEQFSLGVNNPKLRSSQLGWIVSGPIQSATPSKSVHCNHSVISEDNDSIDKMLTKFWDLEEMSVNSKITSENECEKHFLAHTTRTNTGRFCVKLPLKDTEDCLGDTYKLARKRLINMEKRLRRNPTLKSEYAKFIKEYADLGHLSAVNVKEASSVGYYLCHHAVLKQESESTKLRVVFDGSAPSSSGCSLNDILMVGPNVQDTLFSILIRSRQYKYLLTGDIEKMYRQVLVHEDDRHLQRILWREEESDPIQTFDLNTLTYGTASASYLSTRCLWQVGQQQDDELIKCIIQRDFYVDDLITGSDDAQELIYIHNCVCQALKSACFNLRKFKTNNSSIFNNVLLNEQDKLVFSESSSTLGLGWTPSSDVLHFPIKGFSSVSDQNITKRIIMSNAFKIFDPLGILSPVVVKPKIMLQRLWQLKLDWDQPVPNEIKDDWNKFTENINFLSTLQVPRLVLGESPEAIELHTFSDASKHAYGACVYMRSIHINGDVTVRLLCAKSKVAPIKPTSIPRLELCAALLAAKLTRAVMESLRRRPNILVHWCDSTVVLCWIRCDVSKLKVYVANRITEIKELTSSSAWRYVPTHSNPADLISRGVDARRFISMALWWTGPSFLLQNKSEWPKLNVNEPEIVPEVKVHSVVINESIINFDKYSALTKLQRVYAYILRFVFNLKNKDNKRIGVLSVNELRESFYSLCVIAQGQTFANDYELLLKNKPLSNNSKLLSLSPFLDENKLIRVGGRLGESTHSFGKKHPILLHAGHRLTKLYFKREHISHMHAGPQLLLAVVRETVWPINGRNLARRTVNNCARCRRLRGTTLQPKMGNLPPQRITADYPFLSVGLDFAGPFYIINRKGRGSRVVKCYLCLFVCLRYKCIHLEAVSDLSKEAFIMTLRRFIGRRGKPVEIFSDNGGNFVAAAKEIGTFLGENQEPLSDFASQQSIQFKFIPAYTPHFGGIWEAGVKSAKYFIRRVIGDSHFTFEEISTLFAQVEAILNSRPLCPLSSNPDDLLPLSPGHFIIGRPLTALPAPKLEDVKESQLRRYERLERTHQHFWKRWQREYLSELQQRTKWKADTSRLDIGDMVLLADDNAPPLAWKLGRVTRLISGTDGISRVADVLTNRGIVRRSLVRLCRLPTAEELKDY